MQDRADNTPEHAEQREQREHGEADHAGGHGHASHGGHGHSHAPASFGRAFAIGTTLNFGFVIAEIIYGIAAGSVALLADAGHNFGDVLGLLIAWGPRSCPSGSLAGATPMACAALRSSLPFSMQFCWSWQLRSSLLRPCHGSVIPSRCREK